MARITGIEPIASGKFIELQRIDYVNDDGKSLRWEACQRVNQTNAVGIFAVKPQSGTIVLVRQFRPPVGKYSIECPAGLIEKGENPCDSARRELLEETGYTVGRILKNGFAAGSSAGLTGELSTPIVVLIDETIPRKPQALDESEHIEVLEVPLAELCDFLTQSDARGDVVSGKLLTFAYGMAMKNLMMSF